MTHHLTLSVTDLDASVRWCQTLMGDSIGVGRGSAHVVAGAAVTARDALNIAVGCFRRKL